MAQAIAAKDRESILQVLDGVFGEREQVCSAIKLVAAELNLRVEPLEDTLATKVMERQSRSRSPARQPQLKRGDSDCGWHKDHVGAVFNELRKAERENGSVSHALPAALKTVFTLASIPIHNLPIKDLLKLQDMAELLEGEDRCGGSLTVDLTTLREISTTFENRHIGNTREQICCYLDFLGLNDQTFATAKLSPTYSITLPHKKRQLANIPAEATHYCFCYPLATTYEWPEGVNKADPLLDLFQVGGFLYLQQERKAAPICAINSFTQSDAYDSVLFLGQSLEVPALSVVELESLNRLAPMTLWDSKESVVDFGWVTPHEELGATRFTRSGGIAYRYTRRQEGKGGKGVTYSFFLPIIGTSTSNIEYKLVKTESIHFPVLSSPSVISTLWEMVQASIGKFVAQGIVTGKPVQAAHGLPHYMGIDAHREGQIKQDGLGAIRAEFMACLAIASTVEGTTVQSINSTVY
jgi:hypothetical protein